MTYRIIYVAVRCRDVCCDVCVGDNEFSSHPWDKNPLSSQRGDEKIYMDMKYLENYPTTVMKEGLRRTKKC